jgi:DNA-binding MarR family transcriptional regulator
MTGKPNDEAEMARGRKRSIAAIRDSLREVGIQLALLNHQISARLELKDVDLDCLNLIDRDGPLNPSALVQRTGLHPATMTGILDRLERGGWIARDRDPSDRRAVIVRALRDRNPDLMRLYQGMNRALNEILAGYDDTQLALLADFLNRTAEAGREATDDLADH